MRVWELRFRVERFIAGFGGLWIASNHEFGVCRCASGEAFGWVCIQGRGDLKSGVADLGCIWSGGIRLWIFKIKRLFFCVWGLRCGSVVTNPVRYNR